MLVRCIMSNVCACVSNMSSILAIIFGAIVVIFYYHLIHFAFDEVSAPVPSFRIFYWTCYHRTPQCQIWILNWDVLLVSFRLCNWLSLRCLVSWINHLPSVCWPTFRKINFNQRLGCNFNIMGNTFHLFISIFAHVFIYVSLSHGMMVTCFICFIFTFLITVNPVYNDHLLGYFSAFWSSSRWPRAT